MERSACAGPPDLRLSLALFSASTQGLKRSTWSPALSHTATQWRNRTSALLSHTPTNSHHHALHLHLITTSTAAVADTTTKQRVKALLFVAHLRQLFPLPPSIVVSTTTSQRLLCFTIHPHHHPSPRECVAALTGDHTITCCPSFLLPSLSEPSHWLLPNRPLRLRHGGVLC